MKNNIILIGFMGSGKTTIGNRLSHEMNRPMLDTDSLIEEKQGRGITEMFAAEGEAFFRQLETECLQELLTGENAQIIATGGGLPMKEENRPLLKQLGTVVYLKVTAGEVVQRLAGDTTRPLLQGNDFVEKTTALLEKREAVYEETADIVIDTTGKDKNRIVHEVLAAMKGAKL